MFWFGNISCYSISQFNKVILVLILDLAAIMDAYFVTKLLSCLINKSVLVKSFRDLHDTLWQSKMVYKDRCLKLDTDPLICLVSEFLKLELPTQSKEILAWFKSSIQSKGHFLWLRRFYCVYWGNQKEGPSSQVRNYPS